MKFSPAVGFITTVINTQSDIAINVIASYIRFFRTSTLLSASNRLRGDHFPVQYEPRSGADGKDNRRRCRICSKKSNVRCNNVNCNVGLCINDCGDEPNCWAKFHNKKKKKK